jgi:autoinducer 2 (AI-2) kinase
VTPDTSGLGAALCAGVGAGIFPDVTAAASTLANAARRVTPASEQAATYRDLYDGWRQVHAAREEADRVAAQVMMPFVLASTNSAAQRAATVRPRIPR